jgi:mRNA interferase MazF
MRESSVILTPITQANGRIKNRPAIVLRYIPPHNDVLVCGVSTQLHHYVEDFDEIISVNDSDFSSSGLLSKSLIRLGFLAVLPTNRIIGTIGYIAPERHQRLLKALSKYLISN